ncbi:MAG: C40 family peptidase [Deltaproteobacteria bacterium]|jgi:hypothetical protein|nr:C40 family peptidase [Deltaproteobacteria bacterium]
MKIFFVLIAFLYAPLPSKAETPESHPYPFAACIQTDSGKVSSVSQEDSKKTVQNFIVETVEDVFSPRLAKDTKVFYVKGTYFHVRGYCENIYFKNVELLNRWLDRYKLPMLIEGEGPYANPVLRAALRLMLTLKHQVRLIQENQTLSPLVYREMQRFINSPANYFYRVNGPDFRIFSGYVIDGKGINGCNKTVDPSWGLDCSGFAHRAYQMAGACWPYMKTTDLWLLHDNTVIEGGEDGGGKFRPYEIETIRRFFTSTDRPAAGDIVIQTGHLGIYVDENYSLAMNGNGIGLEFYRLRPVNEKAASKGRPNSIFLHHKGLHSLLPSEQICRPYERCDACNEVQPAKFFREIGSSKKVKKKLERYEKPPFYSIEDTKIIARDSKGYGSGADLCIGQNTVR